METPNSRAFIARVRSLSHFDYSIELASLVDVHGETLELLQAIIDNKLLPKEEACRYWADGMNVAYVDPFASIVTEQAVARIPNEIARKLNALGLYVFDDVLTVALDHPTDPNLLRQLEMIVQSPISAVFSLPGEIKDAIAVHYSSDKGLAETLSELERSDLFDDAATLGNKVAELAEANSLAQILDEIVYFAIRERATDIHVEAMEMHSRIRFRVDGNLREVLTYSRKLHRALVSRIKILCQLNISETRFPQDGRYSMQIGSQKASFRVSTIPSAYGEKAAIRLLAMPGKSAKLTLDKMMMSQTILIPFRRLIQNPAGIVFVTGPTGSGKTTTLYAALDEINTPGRNISTIEDPIEIQLAGVTQSQVNEHIDLKFSTILRALMRQDPDVILIGEIRDRETAKIATEAALTGHIVFATLHTNSAPQAIVRLLDIGVEPYMVAPSIIGVLGQRLAARICEGCKEAYYPEREVLLKYFEESGITEVPFYRGRGCQACRQSGFKGRVAVHELVLITEEIRTLITEGKSAQEISRAAAKVGYTPLRYDGLKKVLLGLTTIEEIEQTTSFEWAT